MKNLIGGSDVPLKYLCAESKIQELRSLATNI